MGQAWELNKAYWSRENFFRYLLAARIKILMPGCAGHLQPVYAVISAFRFCLIMIRPGAGLERYLAGFIVADSH